MPVCRQCQMKLELDYAFCPRCGFSIGNVLLAPNPDECVHERHGALAHCIKCGFRAYEDDTLLRRGENTQWGVLAGVCAALAFAMFYLANPSRIPKDDPKPGRYARAARVQLTIAVLALGGVGFCLFRMRLFGERDN